MSYEAQMEMPKYKCHKTVWAFKIAGIEIKKDGSATIAPADEGYATFHTAADYIERFKGSEEDLGYYVRYPGGYESWSPSAEFESGYTRV